MHISPYNNYYAAFSGRAFCRNENKRHTPQFTGPVPCACAGTHEPTEEDRKRIAKGEFAGLFSSTAPSNANSKSEPKNETASRFGIVPCACPTIPIPSEEERLKIASERFPGLFGLDEAQAEEATIGEDYIEPGEHEKLQDSCAVNLRANKGTANINKYNKYERKSE